MWSNGEAESAPCSAGKGHCCAAPADTEGVGCTDAESHRDGSNCTAINTGAGHAITERKREHNGWKFWNTFVAARGIALHQHHTVTGQPLSMAACACRKTPPAGLLRGAPEYDPGRSPWLCPPALQ